MLKEFLHQKNISIYKLAVISGIPYSTLNDIVNHKVDIANIRAGIVYKLANILDIPMDELYQLCTNRITIYLEDYSAKGTVSIKNKKYVLDFHYKNREFTDELCPVKKEATMFIESIARWQMEKMISDYEMEEIYELCIKEKR
ncbi:MAG: helix-turn-helix domain-containing protein [Lachnospira sp.]